MGYHFECEGVDCGRRVGDFSPTYDCDCGKEVGYCCYQFWKKCFVCEKELCEECQKGCEISHLDYKTVCNECYEENVFCNICKNAFTIQNDLDDDDDDYEDNFYCLYCYKDICYDSKCRKKMQDCDCIICVNCEHDQKKCEEMKRENEEFELERKQRKCEEMKKENEELESEKNQKNEKEESEKVIKKIKTEDE